MPAKPRCVNLRDHEVRQLLSKGVCLWVRPMKPQPPDGAEGVGPNSYAGPEGPSWFWWRGSMKDGTLQCWPDTLDKTNPAHPIVCPAGSPGDVVCGREAYRIYEQPATHEGPCVGYRADLKYRCGVPMPEDAGSVLKWRSPATMPRWASRLSPVIAKVECRRVNSITEGEAQACGLERPILHDPSAELGVKVHPMTGDYRDAFMDSWDGSPDSWAWFVTLTTGEQK